MSVSLTANNVASHASCDREDITRARITQDVGVTAVIDRDGMLLAISSDHVKHGWVRRVVTHEELQNVHVSEIFREEIVDSITKGVHYCKVGKPPKCRTYACDIFFRWRTYVTLLLQQDGRIVIEIEDFSRNLLAAKTIVDTSNEISKLTSNTSELETVNDLCKAVFSLTKYDRAMTYKFLGDLSGEVVYELKKDTVTSSFLGMRFPAGDIPLPARKAYLDNPVRFIADVGKPCCTLMLKNTDIALSRTFLRGCVPAHKSYLKAMGVVSSLSMAITNLDGQLWGLVAMHSYTAPNIPTIEDRVFYGILASVASNHVQHIENLNRIHMERAIRSLFARVDIDKSLAFFVVQNADELLETFSVDAISVFAPDDESPTVVGKNGVTLQELPTDHDTLSCGCLQSPLRSFACISMQRHRVVFTRSSLFKPISWAGNPTEVNFSQTSPGVVMPRKSFEKYLDHNSKVPPPFTEQERTVLAKVCDILRSILYQMRTKTVEKKMQRFQEEHQIMEMKSDEDYTFFANMSHELRTPLHAISGIFDILNNMDTGEHVQTIMQSITRYAAIGLETAGDMTKTLDNILYIMRKTHEQKTIDVSLVMLKEVFGSTLSGLRVFAQKKNVGLKAVFKCDTSALLRLDVQKTTHIFNNICGNAIKFSKDDQEVKVEIAVLGSKADMCQTWESMSVQYSSSFLATETVASEDVKMCSWLVLHVRDVACGIAGDKLPGIFERFTQVADVITKEHSSTGLGLNICLLNAQILGGLLGAASTEKEGSLFFCALPIELAQNTTETEKERSLSASTNPTMGHEQDKLAFVLVDDSKVNLMIAKKQIERAFANASVYTAMNGQKGIEEVERLENKGISIDGVFLDFHMPIMSGVEAARRLRMRRGHERLPITMLTADASEISRQAMVTSGLDFLLLKPSKPSDIIAICVKMIEMKRDKKKES